MTQFLCLKDFEVYNTVIFVRIIRTPILMFSFFSFSIMKTFLCNILQLIVEDGLAELL